MPVTIRSKPRRILPAMLAAVALLAASGGRWTARAEESVSFHSRDGDTGGAPTMLSGALYRPEGDGPFAAIVLMHGCGGLHERSGRLAPRHADWARRFFLQALPFVRPERVGLMGWSHGGSTVVWTVADGAPIVVSQSQRGRRRAPTRSRELRSTSRDTSTDGPRSGARL